MSYNPDFNDINLLETKEDIGFSQDIKDEVKRLQLDKKSNINLFGSFIYRYQKYHGDIDIIEDVIANSDKELINKFSKRIKEIVRDVNRAKNHYYSEIKCGNDKVYELKVGYLDKGIYYVNPTFKQSLINLYNQKLLDQEDYDRFMLLLISDTLDQNVFDEVVKIIREYYILRWTDKEVLSGKKLMRSGKYITLEEACQHKTLCKIDTIVLINGVFIETTNIYGLMFKEDNKLVEVTPIFKTSILTLDVEKLYYSDMWYSPFKMLKRAYSYCRFMVINEPQNQRDQHMNIIKVIVPFLVSNISWLSQIKGFLEDMNKILKKFKKAPLKEMNIEIDHFKNYISNIQEISQEESNQIFIKIEQIKKSKNNMTRIALQDEIINLFISKINNHTIKFLNSIGWQELPEIILPNDVTIERPTPLSSLIDKQCKISYRRGINRRINENPFRDFKESIRHLEMNSALLSFNPHLMTRNLNIISNDDDDMNTREQAKNLIINDRINMDDYYEQVQQQNNPQNEIQQIQQQLQQIQQQLQQQQIPQQQIPNNIPIQQEQQEEDDEEPIYIPPQQQIPEREEINIPSKLSTWEILKELWHYYREPVANQYFNKSYIYPNPLFKKTMPDSPKEINNLPSLFGDDPYVLSNPLFKNKNRMAYVPEKTNNLPSLFGDNPYGLDTEIKKKDVGVIFDDVYEYDPDAPENKTNFDIELSYSDPYAHSNYFSNQPPSYQEHMKKRRDKSTDSIYYTPSSSDSIYYTLSSDSIYQTPSSSDSIYYSLSYDDYMDTNEFLNKPPSYRESNKESIDDELDIRFNNLTKGLQFGSPVPQDKFFEEEYMGVPLQEQSNNLIKTNEGPVYAPPNNINYRVNYDDILNRIPFKKIKTGDGMRKKRCVKKGVKKNVTKKRTLKK